MSAQTKPRDYLFDNYKALLIFLVVVGHFVGPSTKCNDFLLVLKWFIVSFHMPAFVFVSGYFSKKDLPLSTIVQRLLVPYLVYEFFYFLLYTVILQQKTSILFFMPKFTLWYLLSLCFWRIITPYVKKIPYHTVLAVIAGLLIGFSKMNDGFLTIPRALVFYPFYLAGTSFERETLNKLRNRKGMLLSLLTMILLMLFLGILACNSNVPMQIFYGRYSYHTMKQGTFEGFLWRIGAYLIGTLWTFALMVILPEKKLCFSYIGTRTMAVYLFHGLLYTYLNSGTKILKNLNTPVETFIILAGCAALTIFFSWMPFTTFTNKICRLKIGNKNGTA